MGYQYSGTDAALQSLVGTKAGYTLYTMALWVKNPDVSGVSPKVLMCHGRRARLSVNAEEFGGGTPTAGALYFGRSWNTTDQVTEVASPTNLNGSWANWNHIAVTYDGSATTNAATFYVNGVAQTNSFTRTAASAGGLDVAADPWLIGANWARTMCCTGITAEAGGWNVILTPAEIAQLAAGVPCNAIRFSALTEYVSCFSQASPQPNLAIPSEAGYQFKGTTLPTWVNDHPPIQYAPAPTATVAPGMRRPQPKTTPVTHATIAAAPTSQTFLQTLTAAATGMATDIFRVLKNLTATGTGTATDIFRVNKTLSASSTGTPTDIFRIGKNLSVTATGSPVLAVTKVVLQTISAAATGTASLIKQAGKILSASGTGTATDIFRVNKNLSVTSTGTPTLTASKLALLVLSAAATGTATLIKRAGKVLAAGSTGTPAAFKFTAGKNLTVTATGTPSFIRKVSTTISASGTGTATLSLVKVFLVTISAAATGTASLIKRAGKVMSAAGTGTPAAFKFTAGKNVTVTSTGSATLIRRANKTLSATGTGTATISTLKRLVLTITATATGTASFIKRVATTVSSSGTGTASVQKLVGKKVTATATGTPTMSPSKIFSVVLSVTVTGIASLIKAATAGVPTLIGVRFGRPKKPRRRRPELR